MPGSSVHAIRSVSVLGALALFVWAGCRNHPQPSAYPVGIFGVTATADLREVRRAGFNVVVGPGSPEFLDAAVRENLVVLARAEGLGDSRIFLADRHPGLWSWYVVDEPDMARLPPSEVETRVRDLRRAGARKPTALTLWGGREADRYGRLADWLIVDRYPVPWMPLGDFPKHLRLGRFAAGPDRPVLAALQAFDWSAFPRHFPPRPGLRPPTREELRAMAFLSLLEGARGLLFYTYAAAGDPGWNLRAQPETWEAVLAVVRDVREFEPLFLGTPEWRDFEVRYPDPSTQWNEVFDPAIQAAPVRITTGSARLPAGRYVLAVNTTSREIRWRFRSQGSRPSPWVELGTGRVLIPGPTAWIEDRFEPYAVRIYGPDAALLDAPML